MIVDWVDYSLAAGGCIKILLIYVDPLPLGRVQIVIESPSLARRQLKANNRAAVVFQSSPVWVCWLSRRSKAAFCVYNRVFKL